MISVGAGSCFCSESRSTGSERSSLRAGMTTDTDGRGGASAAGAVAASTGTRHRKRNPSAQRASGIARSTAEVTAQGYRRRPEAVKNPPWSPYLAGLPGGPTWRAYLAGLPADPAPPYPSPV